MELIKSFKNGKIEAFEKLLKRYQKKVYNTTYRMTGNSDEASDLAQETFLRVYKKIYTFKEKASFSTWLFRITTNLCRDHLRRKKREPGQISLEETGILNKNMEDSPKNNPEQSILRAEINSNIQTVIKNLPQLYREVIILREFQDFSYEEIASILNISTGTVKSRLSRAREKLRHNIKHLGVRNHET